jgi:hypothetical protein
VADESKTSFIAGLWLIGRHDVSHEKKCAVPAMLNYSEMRREIFNFGLRMLKLEASIHSRLVIRLSQFCVRILSEFDIC